MKDYTEWLNSPEGSAAPVDNTDWLNAPPTKEEGKGHVFRQAGAPAKSTDSLIARMLGKYAPEAIDIAGGASATMRGGLNMVSPDLGEKYFPSSAVDKESWPYVAGQVIDPAAYAIGGVFGKAVGMTKAAQSAKAIPRMLASGVSGAGGAAATTYLGTEGNLGDAGMSGLFGFGLGSTMPLASKGLGWLTDLTKGNLDKVKAGEIARAAAGGNLEAIKQAMKNAPKGATAGEAAYGIDQDMWQALQKLAEENDPSSYYRLMKDQKQASRLAKLASVTPDVDAAEAARKAYASKAYPAEFEADRARRAAIESGINPTREFVLTNPSTGGGYFKPGEYIKVPLTPKLKAISDNSMFRAVAKEASSAISEDIRVDPKLAATIAESPERSLQGLHAMKTAIDEQLKNPDKVSGLSKYSNSALAELRKRLIDAMDELGSYGQIREQFAKMSEPVNQGRVLGELSSVLKAPAQTGERSVPFLNATGRGEESALRKAGLDKRFGGIEDVLTPAQNAAVSDVKTQLIREAELAAQAKAGSKALNDVAEQFRSGFRLPSTLNKETTFTNKFLEFVEKQLNIDTKQKLIEGMKNGQSALEMLNTLPANQRNKLLLFLNQSGAAGVVGSGYGAVSNDGKR